MNALHNYTAQQPDELSLYEGDVINVLKKLPDGKHAHILVHFIYKTKCSWAVGSLVESFPQSENRTTAFSPLIVDKFPNFVQ